MGLLFMIIVGAILGWLGSIVLRIEAPRGVLLNIAAGLGGALLTGLFIAPLVGGASLLDGNYSVGSLLLSLVGAIVVVAGFNAVYGHQLR
jgi:uncharacterized membrane protein YeaQ/YmgE (transglycosylase-associated protein family)